MRRFLVVLILCAAFVGQLEAQGAALAFRDDPDIAKAFAEYIMDGRVPVTNSFVFSGNEAAEILAYDGRLAKDPGFKSRLLFSFNPGIIGVTGIEGYKFGPGADPTLLYYLDGVPVFLELGAGMAAGDAVAGKVKLDSAVRQNYVGADPASGALSFYAPWNITSVIRTLFSWRFPQEGWISTGTTNYWIAAGRFKAGLGDGHFGNTFLNSRAEWYDQVQGALGNENLRFTSLIGTSATHLNQTEALIQYRGRTAYDAGNNSIDPWDPINNHDLTPEMEAVKMFAYSQLEARFWDRFRFGIGQMNMIGGKYPGLADILPTVFWHNNYTAGYTNVMLSLSAALVPFDGLQLFGEFTLDDFRGADEDATTKPASYGWQAGGSYSFKPEDGLIVTTGGEYTSTSEWIYCRWQPYLTMYQRHIIGPSWGTDWPLGFAYGPDANHVGVYAKASLKTGASLELDYEYLQKGPIYMGMTDANGNPIYYDYDTRTDITRSSSLAAIEALPDQLSHGVTLRAAWPLSWGLEVNAALQYWNHTNYRNVAGDSRQFFLYSGGLRWKY
ncbi:MAG: hypothetical protein NT061_12925 [Spirochaetes bacterium]|nr:hypothetical protein [Spirochaetota bacterium]